VIIWDDLLAISKWNICGMTLAGICRAEDKWG